MSYASFRVSPVRKAGKIGRSSLRTIPLLIPQKMRPPAGGRQDSRSNVRDLIAEFEGDYFIATLVIELHIAACTDNDVLSAANIV